MWYEIGQILKKVHLFERSSIFFSITRRILENVFQVMRILRVVWFKICEKNCKGKKKKQKESETGQNRNAKTDWQQLRELKMV